MEPAKASNPAAADDVVSAGGAELQQGTGIHSTIVMTIPCLAFHFSQRKVSHDRPNLAHPQ
jgi:hypothetical protein